MKTIKSCEFNTTGCAELRFRDGSMIFIDCIAAENEVADNRLRRSERPASSATSKPKMRPPAVLFGRQGGQTRIVPARPYIFR